MSRCSEKVQGLKPNREKPPEGGSQIVVAATPAVNGGPQPLRGKPPEGGAVCITSSPPPVPVREESREAMSSFVALFWGHEQTKPPSGGFPRSGIRPAVEGGWSVRENC